MIECQEVSQEANTLHVKFKYTHQDHNVLWKYSSEYICGALQTKFAFCSSKYTNFTNYDDDFCLTVSVRFKKNIDEDDSIYTCKIINSQKDLLVKKLKICDDHWIPIAIVSNIGLPLNDAWSYVFEVTLQCEIYESHCAFSSFYDDTESADFKLCGENGSVLLHKTILAAYSPVIQTMLAGEWKDSQEGSVALEGVSLETLQHLKDYMYLNRLPARGLQELCLLASYYMMQKLVVQCCAKLINHLTVDEVFEVAEFALKNRLRNLYIAVLKTMGGDNSKIVKLAEKTIQSR